MTCTGHYQWHQLSMMQPTRGQLVDCELQHSAPCLPDAAFSTDCRVATLSEHAFHKIEVLLQRLREHIGTMEALVANGRVLKPPEGCLKRVTNPPPSLGTAVLMRQKFPS